MKREWKIQKYGMEQILDYKLRVACLFLHIHEVALKQKLSPLSTFFLRHFVSWIIIEDIDKGL